MSIFRPFKAIRPCKELASSIAALPYDVYSSAEARKIVAENPYSFLKIDRAETQFPDAVDMYSQQVYDKAHETLRQMIADGSFIQDHSPCYYIYSLTMDGRTQTGLAGCASVDDYLDNVILKHENTLETKELDRIRHVETCRAHTGPVFLTCRSVRQLSVILSQEKQKEPLYDFISDDNIHHQIWRIDTGSTIENISQLTHQIPHLYIADGHHRAASAVKAGLQKRAENPGFSGDEEYNYFLSVLFPADELKIYDYNRIITDTNSYTFHKLLAMIREEFVVTRTGSTPYRPRQKGEFGMYHNGFWYCLKLLPGSSRGDDPVSVLDVSVLQEHILKPLFHISDPKNDSRIRFIGGIRGLKVLEEYADSTGGVAFSMYPTSMEELLNVADAGMLMPPKSTWFEPKLRSGLIIHEF